MEVSSSLAATTPGSSLTFSCAALRAFPAPRVLWRAELAGERTIVLEEEGKLSTETLEDGTVSTTYSTLKVSRTGEQEELDHSLPRWRWPRE